MLFRYIPAPYAVAIAMLFVAGTAGVGYMSGKRVGVASQLPLIEAAYKEAATHRVQSDVCGSQLRELNAFAAEERTKASERQRIAATAVAEAEKHARTAQQRVSALERTLRAERSTCTEANARICGVPLQ